MQEQRCKQNFLNGDYFSANFRFLSFLSLDLSQNKTSPAESGEDKLQMQETIAL